MSEHDPYRDIAPFYDLEFDSFDTDIDLYVNYATVVGGPALDIGCGTGRVLLALAKAGIDMVGVDTSSSMLERARRRVADQGLSQRVTLIEADARDLSALPSSQFRLVYCAINSFLHLETRDDQIDALSSIRGRLHRDGILVLDVLHPTPATLQRIDDHLRHDGSWNLHDGSRVDRFSQRRLRSAAQLIETTLFYDRAGPDGALSRATTSYLTRYIHRYEMESLLSETCFELEGIYGSYELDPLDDESEQMIVIAHRSANAGEE